MSSASQAFGVYVHWPFCLSKCPYCDFNSHVRHAPVDEERFVRAFDREIATTAARAPAPRGMILEQTRPRPAPTIRAAPVAGLLVALLLLFIAGVTREMRMRRHPVPA